MLTEFSNLLLRCIVEVMGTKDIIIVYPVKETALSIRSLIEKNGFHVSHVCALGSSALEIAYAKQKGIIICPFLMKDMSSSDLAEQVPQGFDIITLPLPMNRNDFLCTIAMLASSKSSFTRRSEDEEDYILKAKQALMSCEGMSEMQAHKHLQNISMKTGKKLVAVAMDILDKLT